VKIFFLTLFLITLFLAGCTTVPIVKLDPIPASEVHLYETKGKFILITEDSAPDRDLETGRWMRFVVAKTTTVPIDSLIKNSQYIGKITWSGTLPEIYVPESASGESLGERDAQFSEIQDLPERMKNEMKAHAGQIGGNLLFVERWSYNYQWIVENGNFKPKYLFWGKVYFVTNSP